MKYLLIIILLSISVCNGYSQSNQEEKTGSWFTYAGTHRISDKLSICTLSQVWMFEIAENFNFILLYGGLNYHVSPKLTTTLAYGYGDIDGGFYTDKPHTYENRIFEQITYKHKVSNLPVDHRFRVEQRFFHKYDFKSTSHRLRYRLGTKLSLNKRLFFRVHNEFLATLQDDILPENRLYTALGINISQSCNVQLGYLNRKINGLNLHRLQAGLYIKTDHRKKRQ
ncbi:DUF2490 domain-containing protein [Algibacter pectinivorans]|uniref:DUF2490 domain-containing protein n=1 Tax=Algibacter pectinivorans TaxID=870482 RepID=A0A1I1QUL2_9FLAO|nr:DUF2490 domain-containing protein [Algibacter pectinivorans]SFD25692.1 Protein of unknown function [Algibacter pectinivorans]